MTTQPRRLRFPMFLKFLVGCLVLAGLLIYGGTVVVRNETQLRSRGSYLERSLRRYHGYEERVGRALTGTLELLAADPQLQGMATPAPTPENPAPTPDLAAVAAFSKQAFERMSGKNGLQPDVFAVFTVNNKLVWAPPGSPIKADTLAELAAVEKARDGSTFAHRLQLIAGTPYQVSALPIRDPRTEEVVGGILAGVALQRLFVEFAEQSDDDPTNRTRLTLLEGTTILATAWPEDKQAGLGRAMQPDKIVKMQVGQDIRDVIQLKEGNHDIYTDEIEGYRGLDSAPIGRLAVTRSRASVVDPGSKIPWMEISIGIGLSLVIAFLMGFWITRPIKQFVRQSRDLLAGDTDLNQRIVVSSRDETAALAENINQVFARLQVLASDVQSASFHVGASSAEISAASKQTLAGVKDQTLKIEGSTAAITELSASIQQVAGNAAQANAVAEQSNVAVTSAVQGMQQIRTSVDEAAEKMRELGESSKRIGNIVEVIRQISEQTSMLALNASIEAAHAGEQGRGFAVVADEVSSLARRVGQSAKDIEALIQTIKEQTAAAITSMDAGTKEVEHGSMLVTSTLTGLGELITVVKDTLHAVQEQAVVSDEIARNMDAVQHIAGEVLSGSEESVVQAERLHELAFQLEESIGGFNLDGNGKVGGVEQRRVGGAEPRKALAKAPRA